MTFIHTQSQTFGGKAGKQTTNYLINGKFAPTPVCKVL